jgi:hypothetical protein
MPNASLSWRAPSPKSHSPLRNRGYRPAQRITQYLLGVWCGASWFEHHEVIRHDAVLNRLFGFGRMANCKAIYR